MEWNRRDPPDAAEKRRNELISQFQGNRNPYVDDYTLVEKVGQKVFQSH
jgi:endonuclease I